ncbi:unnamed protein product [Bursaphelenchus okinawaensis]|uniref:Uncharacterized protein n=1 Tax=Bursaphelenchus okinawaensis TaxID=465554 RepID=A0A811KYK3_9BILA|nr:unnamed protein product [Bursaphelenchus okinawaensis]CAG9114329.1 unnamed protein product [Bursaphelenchus okinawaensis]
MTVAPTYSSSDDFYHPRRSNNNLNMEIEHVMRMMAQATLPTSSSDINNNSLGDKSSGLNRSTGMFSSVPTDQCLYIQIPKDNGGGLF